MFRVKPFSGLSGGGGPPMSGTPGPGVLGRGSSLPGPGGAGAGPGELPVVGPRLGDCGGPEGSPIEPELGVPGPLGAGHQGVPPPPPDQGVWGAEGGCEPEQGFGGPIGGAGPSANPSQSPSSSGIVMGSSPVASVGSGRPLEGSATRIAAVAAETRTARVQRARMAYLWASEGRGAEDDRTSERGPVLLASGSTRNPPEQRPTRATRSGPQLGPTPQSATPAA